jgi:hypothetical protein
MQTGLLGKIVKADNCSKKPRIPLDSFQIVHFYTLYANDSQKKLSGACRDSAIRSSSAIIKESLHPRSSLRVSFSTRCPFPRIIHSAARQYCGERSADSSFPDRRYFQKVGVE